jgi:Flp pilus assembly protein TadG
MLQDQSRDPGRTGATVVEAAFVILTLLIFMFAIFEYGRYTMIRHVVANAAREGARLAAAGNVNDTNSFNYQTTGTVTAAVLASMGGQDGSLTNPNVLVYLADANGNNIGTWTNAQVGQNIAVEIDATYSPLLPTFGFLPLNVAVFAKSVMQTEAN